MAVDQFLHGVEVIDIDTGARVITTVRASIIGIVGTAPNADPVAFPLNTPTLIAGSLREAAKLDALGTGEGTLPSAVDTILDQTGAMIVVVRVEEGATPAETLANVLGGVDATTGQYEGVHAFTAAESILGFAPRILIAPGFTHTRETETANAVVAEMIGVAERLRAVIFADCPSTNDVDAIAYGGDFGSKRVMAVDPRVKKTNSEGEIIYEWSSAVWAGVTAKTDAELGWWNSPSNKEINGIQGTERPIDFKMGDASSRANLLNEKKISTIIRLNGFRTWGNRTLSSDQKWAFLSTVRTADIIADSLQAAHLWAVDRGITKNYVIDVTESVNAYLRYLTNMGAILGGTCWADPDLNTADVIASGKIYFDFDFTDVKPAEHITFRSHLTNDYIKSIFDQ